jgi:membrane associated rhomboid family serine protease
MPVTPTANIADMVPPPHRRNRAACAAMTMLIILAVIWLVQFANVTDHYALGPEFGIQPHVLDSLPDIFAAPFLHMSWSHIEGNSLPLLVLGFLAAYRSLVKFAWVTILVVMTSGLFVWLTAPMGSYTVGASAVIAGWLGYVMLRGFFDHRISDIVIGVIAGLVYLGAFEFLPNNEGISWQGHLSGLIAGMLCAWFFRTHHPQINYTEKKLRRHLHRWCWVPGRHADLLVNMRREFFRARCDEVRDALASLDASIVTWADEPEAVEWRQSEQIRRQETAAIDS